MKKQSSNKVKTWRSNTKKRMVDAFHNKCCVCENEYQQELRKCIMVCSNCHRLIEYGHIKVPNNPQKFDESFSTYTSPQRRIIGE